MTKDIGIERIASRIPKFLEAALNYDGKARWVGFYRDDQIEQETGLGILLVDGRNTWAGNIHAWQLLYQEYPTLRGYFDALKTTQGAVRQSALTMQPSSKTPEAESIFDAFAAIHEFWLSFSPKPTKPVPQQVQVATAETSPNALLLDRWDRNLYRGKLSVIESFLSQPKAQKLLLEVDSDRPKRLDHYLVVVKRAGISLLAATTLGGLGYGAYLGISHLQENPIVIQQPEFRDSSNSQPEPTSDLASQERLNEAIHSLLRLCAGGIAISGLGLMVIPLFRDSQNG